MNKLSIFNSKLTEDKAVQELRPGWTIKVHQKIKEGEKTRVQVFEGMIIAKKHGNQINGTITVRRVSGGIGVEKTFPIHLPTINKIEVTKRPKVKRAKLYYLRDKTAKEIRKKTRTLQTAPSATKNKEEVKESK